MDMYSHQHYIELTPTCFGFCSDGTNGGITSSNERPTLPQRHRVSNNYNGGGSSSLLLTSEDREKKQEMDNLIAQAMNGLSFEERQEQQELLHGVEETVTEEATSIDRALQDLDHYLSSNIVNKQGSFYEMAEQMDPEYVHAKAFRLMFLRANEYDPRASADQMIRFFELKHQLFGPEKLVKDITIDDLDEEDMDCLKAGWLQHVGKDRSGREIFVYVGSLLGDPNSFKAIQNYLRAKYFVTMRAYLRSKETQLRGSIVIWYAIGNGQFKSNGRRFVDFFKAARALPEKKAALHLCVDVMRQGVILNACIRVMNGSLRARLRLHFGSQMECQYQLSSYGIPAQELLPVDANGRLNIDRHLRWVHACTMEDATITTCGRSSVSSSLQRIPEEANSITSSSPKDVLFTGGKVSNSEGNHLFHSLVRERFQVYGSGSLKLKRQVVDEIIGKIHQSGGRFLRRQTGSDTLWEELSQEDLRKKVTQSFRNHRRRQRNNNNNSTSNQQNANDCMDTVIMEHYLSSDGVSIRAIMEPNQNDVIFTGTRNSKHVGNQRFLSLVHDFSQIYDSGTDKSKREIVNTIIGKIHEAGGRFLKQQDNDTIITAGLDGMNNNIIGWNEVSGDELRKKTMQAFRNNRRRARRY